MTFKQIYLMSISQILKPQLSFVPWMQPLVDLQAETIELRCGGNAFSCASSNSVVIGLSTGLYSKAVIS